MSYSNYSSSTESITDLFPAEPLVPANFGERLGAALLDGLILLIPNAILTYGIGSPIGSVFSVLLAWLYSALLESGSSQATLGKKALGLKVVNAEGKNISFGQASARHFGKILSTLIIFIGYFWMLWDEKKQTLHDKMGNAFVVKK